VNCFDQAVQLERNAAVYSDAMIGELFGPSSSTRKERCGIGYSDAMICLRFYQSVGLERKTVLYCCNSTHLLFLDWTSFCLTYKEIPVVALFTTYDTVQYLVDNLYSYV
jgi:hypothetical protein